ncbi:MAG: hypothetical protein M1492_04440, partial [Gammaproteobacteria bacterium]|nr:hypothetical protein [Gammaproteobacteria bacterium]
GQCGGIEIAFFQMGPPIFTRTATLPLRSAGAFPPLPCCSVPAYGAYSGGRSATFMERACTARG